MYNENMEKLPDLTTLLNKLGETLPALTKDYQIRSLGIFGSYTRDQQTAESDLDILVSFIDPPGLFKYIQLENHLSDVLGVNVDLVMEDALKPKIGERILNEVVRV